MNKLKIELKKETFEFIFDKCKILIGDNYRKKYEIVNSIKCFFNKVLKTENSVVKNYKNSMYLNENFLETKQFYFFEIEPYFEFSNDLKLGTKSLFLKYLEAVFDGIEFHDEISNVNRLLDIFVKEFFEGERSFDDLTMNVDIQLINNKSLSKMLELRFLKECFIISELDLTYEDRILLQLEAVNRISTLTKEKRCFLIVDVPLLTEKIYKKIGELEKGISIVLVDFIEKSNFLNVDEVYLLDKNEIDLYNEEELFEIQMNYEKNISIDQLKKDLYFKCNRFIANYYNIDD